MRNRNSALVSLILVVALSLGFTPFSISQATHGGLTGYVKDSQRNGIRGVKVSVKNLEIVNQESYSKLTNEEGRYMFPVLEAGNYEISAFLEGFLGVTITFEIIVNKRNRVLYPPDITLMPKPPAPGSAASSLSDTVNALPDKQTINDRESEAAFKAETDSAKSSLGNSDKGPGIEPNVDGVTDASRLLAPDRSPGSSTTAQTAGGKTADHAGRVQLVNLQDTARATNFSQREVVSLPLGGGAYMRSFDELALLVAGISPPPYTPGVRGPGIGFGIGTAGEFSVNGMRARSNNFSIDGSDNNDPDVGVRRQGFVAVVPQSLESINDISISTLLWDAELGRNFGSQVNAVSRYGGSSFRGQAYGFFTDSRLNARNAFDFDGSPGTLGNDPFTRTQAGFTLGGPVTTKKIQFFGSYEHLRVNASSEHHFSVPTLDERRFRGLSEFLVTSGSVVPFTLGIRNGATPLGNNVLSFYPLPNDGGGPYGANSYSAKLPAGGRGDVASLKLSQRIASSATLNARYNFTDDHRALPSIDHAIKSTVSSTSRNQNLSLVFDADISSTLTTLARFSFGRTKLAFSEYPGSPLVFSAQSNERVETVSGPQRLPSLTGPIGQLIIEPYDSVGVNAFLFPQGRVNNTFQYADLIYLQGGNHSFKFGVEIRRLELNSRQDRLYRPLVSFGNGVIAESITDENGNLIPIGKAEFFPGLELATLGLPSYILQSLTIEPPDSTIGLRLTEHSLFAHDNYRVGETFTLNFGVRYEYNTVPGEVNNRIVDSLSLRSISTAGLSRNDPVFQQLTRSLDAYSSVVGDRISIYDPDRNNVAPRIGFAWDPLCKINAPDSCGKTAVRGGYGLFYDTILGAVVSQSRNVFPKEIPINSNFGSSNFLTLNNPPFGLVKEGTLNQLASTKSLAQTLGNLLINVGFAGGGISFTLPQKNLRTPYAQHWHLTAEREIGKEYLVSVAYIGTRGTKLPRLITPNLGPQLTREIPFVQVVRVPQVFASFENTRPLKRPNPALGPYQIIEDSAGSVYHGLQIEARKRYNSGVLFTVAYTWSHAIDDVSDLFPTAGAPVLAQDQTNLRLERGDASFDVRHRLAGSFIWDSPSFENSASLTRSILRSWQIAAIFQASTGQPFSLNLPVDANQDGNLTDRPSTTTGLVFFDGHGSRRAAVLPGRSISDFFRFGENGLVGRNSTRGDGFVNLDVSLTRSFSFSDWQKLRVRAEFFNALNRANFGLPIRVLGAPGFGSSVDTVNPARIIQFALKYQF